MDSMVPLLLVMPLVTERESIYVCSYDNSYHATACLFPCLAALAQTSTAILKEVDLHRFEFYASRIRLLQLSSFMENVSTHIYMAVVEVFHGRTLSPLSGMSTPFLGRRFEWELPLAPPRHSLGPSSLSTVEVCGVPNDKGIRLNSLINDTSRLHRSGSTNSHPLSALSLGWIFLPSTANILQIFTRLTKLTCDPAGAAIHVLRDILKISQFSIIPWI